MHCIRMNEIKSEFDENVSPIAAHCDQLKTLFLADCAVNSQLSQVLHLCRKIHILALKNCTGEICDAQYCELKTLVIVNCPTYQICDVVLKNVSTSGTLQNLRMCTTLGAVSAAGFKEAFMRLQNLLRLDLWGMRIADSIVVEMCKHCTQLNQVDVGRCSLLTDVSIDALATSCLHLEMLSICDNANYTNESVSAIAQKLPLLKEIDISDCSGFTAVGVHLLQAQMALTAERYNRDRRKVSPTIAHGCSDL